MPVKGKWQEQAGIVTLPCSRVQQSDSGSSYSASINQNLLLFQMVIPPIPHQTLAQLLILLCSVLPRFLLQHHSSFLSLLSLFFVPNCSLVNGLLPEYVPQRLTPTKSSYQRERMDWGSPERQEGCHHTLLLFLLCCRFSTPVDQIL